MFEFQWSSFVHTSLSLLLLSDHYCCYCMNKHIIHSTLFPFYAILSFCNRARMNVERRSKLCLWDTCYVCRSCVMPNVHTRNNLKLIWTLAFPEAHNFHGIHTLGIFNQVWLLWLYRYLVIPIPKVQVKIITRWLINFWLFGYTYLKGYSFNLVLVNGNYWVILWLIDFHTKLGITKKNKTCPRTLVYDCIPFVFFFF